MKMKKENDMNKWTFAEYSPWLAVFNVLIVLAHIPCVSAIYRRCTCTILGTLSCLKVTQFEFSEIPKNVSLFSTTVYVFRLDRLKFIGFAKFKTNFKTISFYYISSGSFVHGKTWTEKFC